MTEVKKLFPERLDRLSENALSLKEHLHIQVDDYVLWNRRGIDLNELAVHITVFSE